MVSPNISEQHKQEPLKIDVVSIQSQVVYGCVGNSAAKPVLEQYGKVVAGVPTVLLSNTPLYPSMYGGVIPQDWFEGFLKGLLERNALASAKAIVLGYLGSAEQAEYLAKWLSEIKQSHPDLWIQIDPVLGDSDSGLYVDSRVADVYSKSLCQIANGLTPNHFELEYLTGSKLTTYDEVTKAARSLLNDQTQWVIVTSALPQLWDNDEMQLMIVNKDKSVLQKHKIYHTDAKGTGDVFSAALLAALLDNVELEEAARIAAKKVVDSIKRTAGMNELFLIK